MTAHAFALGAHTGNETPELPSRERVDARCRLIQNEKIGIMDQRATKPKLLAHAT